MIQKAFPLDELSDGYYMAASLRTPDEIVDSLTQALKKFKQTDDYLKIMSHWGIEASGAESAAPIAKLIYSIKSLYKVTKVGYLAGDAIESHRQGGYYRKQMREDLMVVNLKIAEQIGLKIPRSFLRRASRLIQ